MVDFDSNFSSVSTQFQPHTGHKANGFNQQSFWSSLSTFRQKLRRKSRQSTIERKQLWFLELEHGACTYVHEQFQIHKKKIPTLNEDGNLLDVWERCNCLLIFRSMKFCLGKFKVSHWLCFRSSTMSEELRSNDEVVSSHIMMLMTIM